MSMKPKQIPPSVNFHLWKPCNYRCAFCFAVFDDDDALKQVRGGLGERASLEILDALRAAGVEKINFVGGEPTGCPYLPALLRRAKEIGFVTSIVTNGTKLVQVLDSAPGTVDWVGLSVDSCVEEVQAALGRGRGGHVQRSLEYFKLLRERNIRTKLNTVVTSMNWQEDMRGYVLRARPERWKIFQVLPVDGQNDGKVESLLITDEMFRSYVDRHRALEEHGIVVAAETNEDMTSSYAMIDPLGRFFCNTEGRLRYSQPILEIGVLDAFRQVSFDHERFLERGGLYDWRNQSVIVQITNSVR